MVGENTVARPMFAIRRTVGALILGGGRNFNRLVELWFIAPEL
jgi:hypothetical protein